MPGNNADGDVISISLSNVQVQNFDKTITSIPTYKLISDSFIIGEVSPSRSINAPY